MEEARHCAVCKRVLERVVQDERRWYRHAFVDEPADHLPIAVREVDDPNVAYRCDFCLEEPITHTMVVDGNLDVPEIGVVFDPEWAMCKVCADLAMNNHWAILTNRAFVGYENRVGAMSELSRFVMTGVYQQLRDRLVMYYQEP